MSDAGHHLCRVRQGWRAAWKADTRHTGYSVHASMLPAYLDAINCRRHILGAETAPKRCGPENASLPEARCLPYRPINATTDPCHYAMLHAMLDAWVTIHKSCSR
jgi:hypothetical protein